VYTAATALTPTISVHLETNGYIDILARCPSHTQTIKGAIKDFVQDALSPLQPLPGNPFIDRTLNRLREAGVPAHVLTEVSSGIVQAALALMTR
jgi:hypothetical protein